MTIGSIISLVIGGIILLGGIGVFIWGIIEQDFGVAVGTLIAAIIFGAIFIVSPIVYMNTEAGARALKDQQSNFNAGIERIVKVYDVNGKLIEQYEGRFDVETTSSYVLFDDENNKRHMIYYTTGTIIIDEK